MYSWRSTSASCLCLFVCLQVLVGCVDDAALHVPYRPKVFAPKKQPALQGTQLANVVPFLVRRGRDPFLSKSYHQSWSDDKAKIPSPIRTRTQVSCVGHQVLIKYELDALRLKAVITGVAAPFAMIETPDGVGHVVRVGMRIGKSCAQVSRVLSSGLLLKWVRRNVGLTRDRQVQLMRLEQKKTKRQVSGQMSVGGRVYRLGPKGGVLRAKR